MTAEPRIDEAGRGMGEQAEATQGALALQASGDVIRQRHDLVGRPEHELPWMQDERLIAIGLQKPREVGLLDARIDVRVLVVLEHPEPAVEPNVDAGRLDHRLGVGLDTHTARGDLGLQVTVGEQHGPRLPD